MKAFAELDCSRELKTAIHRQTTLQKHEFVPGQKVAYYRDVAFKKPGAKRKTRPGYIPAKFLMYDPNTDVRGRHAQTTAWVAKRGHAIQVSREQLRKPRALRAGIPASEI